MKLHLSTTLAAGAFCGLLVPSQAFAWDEEGHKIVALIADHYLDPAVKQKIDSILSADKDTLTKHDIASEAVWADTFRNLDREKVQLRFAVTDSWHSTPDRTQQPRYRRGLQRPPRLVQSDTGVEGPGGLQPG